MFLPILCHATQHSDCSVTKQYRSVILHDQRMPRDIFALRHAFSHHSFDKAETNAKRFGNSKRSLKSTASKSLNQSTKTQWIRIPLKEIILKREAYQPPANEAEKIPMLSTSLVCQGSSLLCSQTFHGTAALAELMPKSRSETMTSLAGQSQKSK